MPLSPRERFLKQKGHILAGVDEVGRGCLAGPVVACACILPDDFVLEGLNDSKQLSYKQREEAYAQLTGLPELFFSIACIDYDIIDKVNILQATLMAMRNALKDLKRQPTFALIDGPKLPKPLFCEAEGVIGGDGIHASIMAASILAKVTRDRMMENIFDNLYPEYGFKQHKGYGTEKHREALKRLGPCPIHRMSFL